MADITFEQACDDRCLDKIVPSDLRQLVAERDHLRTLYDELIIEVGPVHEGDSRHEAAVLRLRAAEERSND